MGSGTDHLNSFNQDSCRGFNSSPAKIDVTVVRIPAARGVGYLDVALRSDDRHRTVEKDRFG